MFFVNYNLSRFHISPLSDVLGTSFDLLPVTGHWEVFSGFLCAAVYTPLIKINSFFFLGGFHLDTLSSVGQLGQNKDSCSSAKVFQSPGSTAFQGPWAQGDIVFSYWILMNPLYVFILTLSVYIHGKILSKICDLFLHSLFFFFLGRKWSLLLHGVL